MHLPHGTMPVKTLGARRKEVRPRDCPDGAPASVPQLTVQGDQDACGSEPQKRACGGKLPADGRGEAAWAHGRIRGHRACSSAAVPSVGSAHSTRKGVTSQRDKTGLD